MGFVSRAYVLLKISLMELRPFAGRASKSGVYMHIDIVVLSKEQKRITVKNLVVLAQCNHECTFRRTDYKVQGVCLRQSSFAL